MAVTLMPQLWFAREVEEAARLYAGIIPDSRIDSVTALPVETPSGPPGSVKIVRMTLAGVPMVAFSAGGVERNALLAPDIVAAAAARATDDPQAKWLLRQPREVRESYVHDVLDARGDRDLLSTAWLLRQDDDVRESYVREVVEPKLD